jgi:hypothetical protein
MIAQLGDDRIGDADDSSASSGFGRAEQRPWPGYGAIPCTVRAVTRRMACPLGRSTRGTHGHFRTARHTGSQAERQADPLREPTF